MALVFFSTTLEVVVLLVIVALLLLHYLTATFNYWRDRGIPFAPPVLIFGSLRDAALFRCTTAEAFKHIYDAFQGQRYIGFFQARTPSLMVLDPDFIKTVLVKDFAYFHDRGMGYNEEHDPLTAHLINLAGERWREMRNKLRPAFTPVRLRSNFSLVNDCAKELANGLPIQEPFEVREAMAKFTTDVIGTCAFGLRFDAMADPDSKFRNMGRKVVEPSYSIMLCRAIRFSFPAVARALHLRQFSDDVTTFFCEALKNTFDFRQKNSIVRNDFIQLLLKMRSQEVGAMSDTLLAAQAFVFFLAGFETSSTTLTFCLYELAQQPDMQRRLRAEVYAAMEKESDDLTYEAVQNLNYMEMVVAETLRKYPPAGILLRVCTKRYHVPDSTLELEAGTPILVPVYALHHDPKLYPEPERFDPERFSEEAKMARNPYSYLPFGEGPRICIGMRFAIMEIKVALAHLLMRYQVQVCPTTKIPLQFDPKVFVLQAAGNLYLQMIPWTKEEMCS